ncbi:hypothetical protein [Nonomuraea aurantiaca]|uniref:hypothetical protein n=1 Tax=Nonomuraea aurantiaca TaxID=2878562 RepID=UPI001CD9CB50|nr:hypothetical protein [Nonomuraea aurantiaca]MCA2226621.1 hypothetical protein [Nonomuraea aurantiaca]
MSPRRRRRNPGLVLGLGVLGCVVLIAVLAPILFAGQASAWARGSPRPRRTTCSAPTRPATTSCCAAWSPPASPC